LSYKNKPKKDNKTNTTNTKTNKQSKMGRESKGKPAITKESKGKPAITKESKNESIVYDPPTSSLSPQSGYSLAEYDVNNLIVVGVVKVDEHSRLTFTKRIKNVFPVDPGNSIVIYQDMTNNNLLFKVQRENEVSDIWIVKKRSENVKAFYDLSSSREKSKVIDIDIDRETGKGKQEHQKSGQLKSVYNIMIIDDDKDTLEMFKSMLLEFYEQDEQKQKYNVDTFRSSIDATKKFLDTNCARDYSSAYDLIIIDIKIPVINGIQLYQIFRILDLNVKILFISGIDVAGELAGLLPGIRPEYIFKKPFKAEDFISKIDEVIQSDLS
jgi:CheY-like chemotaxis protein